MRWPITILLSLIAPLMSAQQKPPLASLPKAAPTAGFLSADVEGQTFLLSLSGHRRSDCDHRTRWRHLAEAVFSWKQPCRLGRARAEIASLTRVCVYDRVGLGRSSTADRPRTSFDVASELHALLAREKVRPPYVLAGQSLGGMNVLAFANRHHDEVVGVVLVDSSHPRAAPANQCRVATASR